MGDSWVDGACLVSWHINIPRNVRSGAHEDNRRSKRLATNKSQEHEGYGKGMRNWDALDSRVNGVLFVESLGAAATRRC